MKMHDGVCVCVTHPRSYSLQYGTSNSLRNNQTSVQDQSWMRKGGSEQE